MMGREDQKAINGHPAFRQLSHQMRGHLLKNIDPTDTSVLQVQEGAEVIDDQWVVSIYANKLGQCFSSMAAFLNVLNGELDIPCSIEVFARVG